MKNVFWNARSHHIPSITAMTWWRHQMETFFALLAAFCAGNLPVTGEFPSQRPMTRGFDVFFDLRLNKRLSKQLWGYRAHYDVTDTVRCRDCPVSGWIGEKLTYVEGKSRWRFDIFVSEFQRNAIALLHPVTQKGPGAWICKWNPC